MGAVPRSGNKKGVPLRPLLKVDIEQAQRNTKSGAEAARFLRVSYQTYKKWAKIYKLFDSHKNEKGIGIKKPKTKGEYSLESIFAGKIPNYNRKKLKDRVIRAGLLEEKCAICGFSEKRIMDNRTPLTIMTIDDSKPKFALDNLQLVCYNCNFLTNVTLDVVTVRPKTTERDILNQAITGIESLEDLQELGEEAIEEVRREMAINGDSTHDNLTG